MSNLREHRRRRLLSVTRACEVLRNPHFTPGLGALSQSGHKAQRNSHAQIRMGAKTMAHGKTVLNIALPPTTLWCVWCSSDQR
jgi:hypothetical protein